MLAKSAIFSEAEENPHIETNEAMAEYAAFQLKECDFAAEFMWSEGVLEQITPAAWWSTITDCDVYHGLVYHVFLWSLFLGRGLAGKVNKQLFSLQRRCFSWPVTDW